MDRCNLRAAEKEERLRQMMSDAASHDEQRGKRVKVDEARKAEEDERERAALDARVARANADVDDDDGGGPSFVQSLAKDVYADASGASVADRISQQRHHVQRGARSGAENFMSR